MANLTLRKTLKSLGLFERARSIKKRFIRVENDFKPADPRTLISSSLCLQWLIEQDLGERSDYLEFGIYRGFNLWYVQAYARAMGIADLRCFGFDSFFGIPPVDGIDAGGAFNEGDFSAYRDEVEMWLTRYRADWKSMFLVEGFFEDSLTQELVRKHNFRPCVFCTIDCDLYSSTVTVLDFLEPLLAERSLLYFDDWADFGSDQSKGEPRAFAEFQSRHAQAFDFQPFDELRAKGGKGTAFILTRRRS